MNYPAFQTLRDDKGNIYMFSGKALQLSTGVLKSIEQRGRPVNVIAALDFVGAGYSASVNLESLIPATGPKDMLAAGGSARNLILNTGDAAVCTEWLRLPRVFTQESATVWASGYWTITKKTASTAELADQGGVLAEMTTGTAPFGTYDATVTGEDDYNGSAAWSVDAIAEPGTPNFATSQIRVTEGSFPTNEILTSSDGITWAFTDDPLVSVVVSSDGSADLFYDATLVAERAAGGSTENPAGEYVATSAGRTDYNSGTAWSAYLDASSIAPVLGYVYVKLLLASGTLDKIRGPYFSGTLPSDTADLKHVPIAFSDGDGRLEQYHTGLILIP